MLTRLFTLNTYKKLRHWLLLPIVLLGTALSGLGLWFAFWGSPIDYQQKETVRIMYIHVPASWLALFIYGFMGLASIGGFVWRHSMGFIYARAAWPLGFVMCVISLATGSIWGKPMWGTWWVWDARITSMFILMMLYLGYGLFVSQQQDDFSTQKKGAIFLIMGLVNLPIIKYSVEWWSTLHQPASIFRESGVAIASEMMWPLCLNAAGLLLLALALGFVRVDTLMLRQKVKRHQLWENRKAYHIGSKGAQV